MARAGIKGDALIVTAMQANGVGSIASNDSDFDSVFRNSRYAPA
jgi:predicted nucleic acid-binding protein